MEMEDERPEKKLKLDARTCKEHGEILRLKERAKDLEDLLVLRNRKIVEVEESKSKMEAEKVNVQEEKDKVEKEKSKIQEERSKFQEEKNDMEAKRVKFEEEMKQVKEDKNTVEVQRKTMEEERRKLEEAQGKAEGKLAEKLRQLVECPGRGRCHAVSRDTLSAPPA